MSKERYVAYVGTYTHTNSVGIHVYDVDPDTGVFVERSVAPINNPSYLTISKNGKYLYSIADEGVAAFDIDENGDLIKKNQQWIGGMRGDFVEVDSQNRYLFVGGFHDGRVTMMRLQEDGSIGDIACGIFHQNYGLGDGSRHTDHAKVTCVKLTPDEKFLCAVDIGLNQIKVYEINYELGNLTLADIIRPEIDAGVREIGFSGDGKYMYALTSMNNSIEVYKYYVLKGKDPEFERIQTISVLKKPDPNVGATSFTITEDEKYIFVGVDAMNGTTWLSRDAETGLLTYEGYTLNSGEFPKDIDILPGDKFLVVLNHDSSEIRTLCLNMEGGYALMKNAPIEVSKPNCVKVHKL